MKILIVDQVPTPYRVPFYRELGSMDAVSFEVAYLGRSASFSSWTDLDLSFPHTFLPRMWRAGRGDDEHAETYFNVGLSRLVRRVQPDLMLISGWNLPAHWEAAWLARRRHVPYMLAVESHTSSASARGVEGLRNRLVGAMIAGAGAFMAAGTAAKEHLQDAWGVPPRIVTIRPNACDVAAWAAATDQARAGGDAERLRQSSGTSAPVVLFCGRMIERKGCATLIDAAERLRRRGVRLHVWFVGDGPERRNLQHQAAPLGDGVKFFGEIGPDGLPTVFAAADALCLPSLVEPWGVVVHEALAAGIPAVVSDAAGASRDLVVPGTTGETFRAGDPDALAEAIETVLASGTPARREQCKVVAEQWGYGRALDGFMAACRIALERPAASRE